MNCLFFNILKLLEKIDFFSRIRILCYFLNEKLFVFPARVENTITEEYITKNK